MPLLSKEVDNARLSESDLHPITPHTPAPLIPTYRKKVEKNKNVENEKGASSLGK